MIQGLDLVEVSPPYDPAGVTTTLAARLVLDAMGFAMKSKSPKPSVELWEVESLERQRKNEATKGVEGKIVWPFYLLQLVAVWKKTAAHFDSMRCSIGTLLCSFVIENRWFFLLLGTCSETWAFWSGVFVRPFQLPNDLNIRLNYICWFTQICYNLGVTMSAIGDFSILYEFTMSREYHFGTCH